MRVKTALLIISFAGIFALCGSRVFAATYTVDPEGTGDYPTIQAAIDIAVGGDIIQVEDGTYTGDGNRDIDFLGKAITVRGNVVDPNLVMIDCQGTEVEPHRGFKFVNGEGDDSVLEGITITNGYGPLEGILDSIGGAIYCRHSEPVINKCIISNNRAIRGSGVYGYYGSPKIQNCIVNGNSATHNGGGIFNCDGLIENCTIKENSAVDINSSAGQGGGLCSCSGTIRGCFIKNNWASQTGGGVQGSSGLIQNCTISNNSAGLYGGGLSYSDATIESCIVSQNDSWYGGGLYNCDGFVKNCRIMENSVTASGGAFHGCDGIITGCIIADNTSVSQGGGLSSCHGTIQNCTIINNSAGDEGAGLHTCNGTIQNCIVWANTDPLNDQFYNCVTPSYSCIQEWDNGGLGNINDDPLFVKADSTHKCN